MGKKRKLVENVSASPLHQGDGACTRPGPVATTPKKYLTRIKDGIEKNWSLSKTLSWNPTVLQKMDITPNPKEKVFRN